MVIKRDYILTIYISPWIALDLCYAHPNGPGGSYHYHTWSECLSPCIGESQLVGVALDGFPIFGPGINPDTGLVWSQSDMDACGGRDDDNGNYGYYTTVDFPYVLQCYRGELGNTLPSINDGICGLYGTNCESISPGLGPGSPFGGGRPGSRPGSGRPAGAPPSNGRPDDERADSGHPDSGSPGDGPPKNRPPKARKKRSKTNPFANPTKAGFKSTHELMVLKDQALI